MIKMKQQKGVVRKAVFFLLCLVAASSALSAVANLSSNALRRSQLTNEGGLIIVDVRSPEAFALGHIQGALNIPTYQIPSVSLSTASHIVVYCGEDACPLSTTAAVALSARGFQRVELLAGGFASWLAHGYPAEKSSAAQQAEPAHEILSPAKAKARLSAMTPIDVRSPREFSAGHLPQALNTPLETLDASRLDKTKNYLVYDRNPQRSRKAIEILSAAGINVTELAGGLAGWTRKGNSLEVSR